MNCLLEKFNPVMQPINICKAIVLSLVLGSIPAFAVPAPDRVTLNMDCSEPVPTEQGLVSGFEEQKNNNKVCAYKGIPFAAPPVENLRWRAPQAPPHRKTILEANTYGPDCMQPKGLSDAIIKSGSPVASEDCLYLNIWRPAKPGTYPVMVWIHGGALLLGSGAWPIYEGTSFAANQKVVLVTINYRMGPFGYLSHPDLVDINDGYNGGSAGNYGLLDQMEALKWLKQNIESFGGDKNNVTIFGESAGGWSVFTLLASPASQGLYNKAISQSGGSESARAGKSAFKIGEKFAKKLKCDKKNTEDPAACLRQKSAEQVNGKIIAMNFRCMMTIKIGENFCFLPRYENDLLPQKPMDALEAGNYLKVPTLAGYNSKDPWFLRSSTVNSLKAMDGHPRYLYKFKFKKNMMNFASSGIHGAELPLVFDTLDKLKLFNDSYAPYKAKHIERSMDLSRSMQAYWANFARNGDPNGRDVNGETLFEWPDLEKEKTLKLYNKISLK